MWLQTHRGFGQERLHYEMHPHAQPLTDHRCHLMEPGVGAVVAKLGT